MRPIRHSVGNVRLTSNLLAGILRVGRYKGARYVSIKKVEAGKPHTALSGHESLKDVTQSLFDKFTSSTS